jgi:phospholipid/cholesterol/gamma-HCH transport system substrate-binding protein
MRATRRPSGRARGARSPGRELTLGIAVLVLLGLAAWISTIAIDGVPWSSPYEVKLALPPAAPLLHAGDEVRIAGERVGQVQSVTLAPDRNDRAVATLAIGGARIGAGASARIRPRGFAGAVDVDLEPGLRSRPLRSGSTVPALGSVQLTDVVSGFDASARRALARSVTGYGTGLAGSGVTLNRTIAATPPLLNRLTQVLQAVRPQSGVIEGTVGDLRVVAGAVSPPGVLAQLVGGARSVLETTGAHAGAIGATIASLPAFEVTAATVLPGAHALLRQLAATSTQITPGIEALTRALPGIRSLEQRGPALAQLGSVAGAAAPVLSALTPALVKLAGPAAGLTPLSAPIAELANVLIPYQTELVQAPLGFTRWGNFTYGFGTGSGHRAVRFSMVLTCALARDPYPAPGAAGKERKQCP